MKLTTTVQVSVDGVMQGPGGPEEDERRRFERGGWAHFDDEASTVMDEIYQRADAFPFGRRTYEIFAGSWGSWADPGDSPIWTALNTLPKYVASTTLTDPLSETRTACCAQRGMNSSEVGTISRARTRPIEPYHAADRGREPDRLGVGRMPRMQGDEPKIDEPLVRRLLADEFPEWASLPLRPVEPAGTDNAIFRLGEDLAVRLARRKGPARSGGKEFDWLPRLAPLVPLEIPAPVAQGRPTDEYPWFWDVFTWVDGAPTPIEEIDSTFAARDLALFVAALQRVDPSGAPMGRGIPLAERDEEIRYWLARFDGDRAVVGEWERALAAPAWQGPPVWHHGDLDVRNWLVRDGRICAVIDWEAMGVGDPACDVMVAWKLHSGKARDTFREALPTDDATWERARGWVLSQAVAVLAYYTPENNPTLYREAEAWLELVLSEGG